MASVRRKYQSQLAAKDEPPVTTMPQETAAKLPEPAVDAKPPEPITTESPADVAARSALRDRLREMEQAETIVREATTAQQQEPQQPQQLTLEQQIAHLPERIQQWCKTDPRLATDPERIAQAQYCHHVARREVGEEFTDPYYDRMEEMLGLREQPKPRPSNGQSTLREAGGVHHHRVSRQLFLPGQWLPASLASLPSPKRTGPKRPKRPNVRKVWFLWVTFGRSVGRCVGRCSGGGQWREAASSERPNIVRR